MQAEPVMKLDTRTTKISKGNHSASFQAMVTCKKKEGHFVSHVYALQQGAANPSLAYNRNVCLDVV